jgi:hypothetical protein
MMARPLVGQESNGCGCILAVAGGFAVLYATSWLFEKLLPYRLPA